MHPMLFKFITYKFNINQFDKNEYFHQIYFISLINFTFSILLSQFIATEFESNSVRIDDEGSISVMAKVFVCVGGDRNTSRKPTHQLFIYRKAHITWAEDWIELKIPLTKVE